MLWPWPSLLVAAGAALWPAAGQQQPGLGNSPQFFYLAPNGAAALPPPQLRRRTALELQRTAGWRRPGPGPGAPPRMLPPAAVAQAEAEAEAELGAELGQFQAADGRGRAVFGYLLPDQTRVEQRGSDGSVHGAYSYLDADGRAVKVHYWDAGAGFHTASNHLPALALGLPQPVRDTAEVQAARDQHLQQVQAALLQHVHALQLLQQPQLPQLPQQAAQAAADSADSDSLVVESAGHPDPDTEQEPAAAAPDGELTRYPDLQQVAQPLYDPSHVHDPGREAVIVDAEAGAGSRGRARARGKALPLPERSVASPQPARAPDSFYMFWHTVPVYVEVKPVVDGADAKSQLLGGGGGEQALSVSQKAAFAHAQLPAAVHSFQAAPQLQAQLARPQLPLYLSPQPPLLQPPSYSAKASYFHSIPVAAVHDTQVHPNQLGSVPNHQLSPVFLQAPLEGQ